MRTHRVNVEKVIRWLFVIGLVLWILGEVLGLKVFVFVGSLCLLIIIIGAVIAICVLAAYSLYHRFRGH